MPLDQKPVPQPPQQPTPGADSEPPGPIVGDAPGTSGTPRAARDSAADTEWGIRQAGPWTHRDLAANGARFHIAELGEGPLVLLVHGWPEYWWAWRNQMTALAEAGYRAVALDLRGVGGSDRTP